MLGRIGLDREPTVFNWVPSSVVENEYVPSLPPSAYFGDTGLVLGGYASKTLGSIEKSVVSILNDASVFGKLRSAFYGSGACSNGNVGIYHYYYSGEIDSVNFTTSATSILFTQLGVTLGAYPFYGSNGNKALFAGGGNVGVKSEIVYMNWYNSSDVGLFGNLSEPRGWGVSINNDVNCLFVSGLRTDTPVITVTRTIDYVTFTTLGNASFFGESQTTENLTTGCSDGVNGIYGGDRGLSVVTLATTGNSTTFGNLTVSRYGLSSYTNGIRIIFTGGPNDAGSKIMDCVNFSTLSDAVIFGELLEPRSLHASCSGN